MVYLVLYVCFASMVGSWRSNGGAFGLISCGIAFDGEMPSANRFSHHGGLTAWALVFDITTRIPVAVHNCATNQTRHKFLPAPCFFSQHIFYPLMLLSVL